MKRISALMLAILMSVSNLNIAYAEETPAPSSAPTSEPTAETIDVTPENTPAATKSADEETIDVSPSASPSASPTASASASPSASAEPELIDVGTDSDNSQNGDATDDSNLLDVSGKSVTVTSTGEIADISVEDLTRKIASGETLLFMAGNENDDELYQRMIKAYADVMDAVDGDTGTNFYKITSGDSLDPVLYYASESADASVLNDAWSDFVNGTTGHAAVGFVYNRSITGSVIELDDTEWYTVEEMAMINWSVKYDHTDNAYVNLNDYVATPMTGANIMTLNNTTGTPSVALNKEWYFSASSTANNARKYNGLQTFTAPVSGTYYITLWGADGDSDTGSWTRSTVSNPEVTSGIGGQAGTVKGYVDLDAGQTIYLALGFRNEMSDGRVLYGGGGAGWNQSYGYRAGGGGYGAIMSSLPDSDDGGYTDLRDYQDEQDKIMMVAGGGGGAEDFYAAMDGYDTYYCEYNSCINSVGGNGGQNPTGGRSTGPTASTAGYQFGLGQNYNSYDNSSSGGGGAGLMGGLAGDGNSNTLKGGTGAGGTSYINSAVVSNGVYQDGTGLTWQHSTNKNATLTGWDNGRNAGAIIQLVKYKAYKLTINYLDVNDNSVVATQYNGTYTYGDAYSVTSPTVTGYTLADKSVNDAIVSGTMPQHDVVIDVYYDYPKLTINYLAVRDDDDDLNEDTPNDISDNTVLATQYVKRMKSGTAYSVPSPAIDGYEFYEADSSVSTIAGNMPAVDTVINVYYVPVWSPVKRIAAVNGVTITREQSDAGVQLMAGDIVTYEIDYENRRNTAVSKTVEDTLASYLTYNANGGYAPDPAPTSISGQKLTWNLPVSARTRSAIKFSATVGTQSGTTVDNWMRQDPYVALSLVKSSDPVTDTYVATGANITYTLAMTNTGSVDAHNIVIVDAIPKGTEYVTMDTNSKEMYHGAYYGTDGQSDGAGGKYVKYIIDDLAAGAVASVTFTVKNDVSVDGATVVDIPNVAGYQIYPSVQNKDDTTHDSWIMSSENPHKSNQTVHHVTGTLVSAVKSSNPVSGTTVDSGKEIEYKIDVTNEGPTAANYVRVTDKIPAGTSFVGGSLKMSGTNDYKQAEVFDEFSENHNYGIVQDNHRESYQVPNTVTHSLDIDAAVDSGGTRRRNRFITADQNIYAWGDSLNNLSSSYASGGYTYFVYDFGGSVTSFSSSFYSSDSSAHDGPAGIRLDASNDNSNWANLLNKTTYGSAQYMGGSTTAGYRYYRVGVKNTNKWGWGSWTMSGSYTTTSYSTAYNNIVDGYHLNNVSASVNGGKVTNVAMNWTNGLTLNSNAVDWAKWNVASQSATSITLTPKATATGTDISNLLKALKWTGSVGTYGSTSGISINTAVNGTRVSKGYAGSSSACAYVTSNGAPYVECVGTDVAKGTHMYVSFKVKVNDSLPSTLTEIDNVAQYEGYSSTESGNSTHHPAAANQTTVMPTSDTNMTVHPIVGKKATVTATKDSDPVSGSTVEVGSTIKYSVTVKNTGNATAKYVHVRDYIPTGTTYVAGSASDDGAYSTNGYAEWVLKDLAAGASKTVTFSVTVNDDAPKVIRNVALYEMHDTNPGTPGTVTDDPSTSTNEVTHNLKVVPTTPPSPGDPDAAMAAVKSANPVSGTKMNRGDEIEYSITISNTSGNGAILQFVPVRDIIPDGTTYVADSISYSGDARSVSKAYIAGSNSVQWVIQNIDDGGSETLTFKVKIDKETELTQVVNSAKYGIMLTDDLQKYGVTETTFTADKITDTMLTGTTNEVVHPLTQPDVVATKSSDPVTKTIVARGSTIEYTLTVTNRGDGMANYVNVQDAIPAHTTYVATSASTSADGDKASLSADGKSVQYQLYDLAAGETRTVKFSVAVDANAQKGILITNVALYDDYIKNPNGTPGTSTFKTPTKKTNETEHTVEFGTDVIETGGRGWSTLPYIGAGIIGAVLLILVIMKKRRNN